MTNSSRSRDLIYLLGVAACALLFAGQVADLATPHADGSAARAPVRFPTAGEPRDVDMEALRRRLSEGYLSDREALFASPVEMPDGD